MYNTFCLNAVFLCFSSACYSILLALCQVCSCVEGDRTVVVPGIVMGEVVCHLKKTLIVR